MTMAAWLEWHPGPTPSSCYAVCDQVETTACPADCVTRHTVRALEALGTTRDSVGTCHVGSLAWLTRRRRLANHGFGAVAAGPGPNVSFVVINQADQACRLNGGKACLVAVHQRQGWVERDGLRQAHVCLGEAEKPSLYMAVLMVTGREGTTMRSSATGLRLRGTRPGLGSKIHDLVFQPARPVKSKNETRDYGGRRYKARSDVSFQREYHGIYICTFFVCLSFVSDRGKGASTQRVQSAVA